MTDKTVELQSKFASAMLQGVCKAFKIEPTVPGLISGMGGDPEQFMEMVRFVQANGSRMIGSFEAAVVGTAARVERMEREQLAQRSMLIAIMNQLEITPAEFDVLCHNLAIEHEAREAAE